MRHRTRGSIAGPLFLSGTYEISVCMTNIEGDTPTGRRSYVHLPGPLCDLT